MENEEELSLEEELVLWQSLALQSWELFPWEDDPPGQNHFATEVSAGGGDAAAPFKIPTDEK